MDYKRKEVQFSFSPDELNDVNNGRNKPLLWSSSFLFPLFPGFFFFFYLSLSLHHSPGRLFYQQGYSIMNNVSFLSSFFLKLFAHCDLAFGPAADWWTIFGARTMAEGMRDEGVGSNK